MDVVTNLRTFLAVAQSEGFSDAARALDVVPSVVAKRIAQLEQTMGVRLFDRSTRFVALTDAGARLQARASQVVGDFDSLVDHVHREDRGLEGHIRLMLPTTLTLLYLGDVLAKFMAEHERITLEVALADRSMNPTEQAFDIVVSGRAAHYEGVAQIPLAPIQYLLCASPEYLRLRGQPEHPVDLLNHRCLGFRPAGKTWSFGSAKGPIHVDIVPILLVDDGHTLLLSAQQGVGVAILPGYLARPSLMRGELVPLLADFPVAEAWFKAYVPRRVERLERVQRLCERLREALLELPEAHILARGTEPRKSR